MSRLIFAENLDGLVSVQGIHGSLDTAPKTNLLTLCGLPNTHSAPPWVLLPFAASLVVQAMTHVLVQIPSLLGSPFSDHVSGLSLALHEFL